MSNFEVNITRNIKASQETLFNAWVNPEVAKKFMMPMDGTVVSQAAMNPKVGGEFSLVMAVGDNEIPITGEYLEVEKFNKLVFTWLSGHVGQNSVVHLTFKKLSNQETELNLVHKGLDSEQQQINHNGGWSRIIDLLAAVDEVEAA